MKIISWNTNGIRATIKQGNFAPLFDTYKPDVVCFQETKCEPDQLPEKDKIFGEYTSYFTYSKKRKGYSGVGIYTKIKPEKVTELGNEYFDSEGRTLVMYFKKFVLINCYFPNGGGGPERLAYKLEFYDYFLKFCEKVRAKGYEIIFCGDINTAHTEIDLARPKENIENTGFLPIERAWIDKLIKKEYKDVYRTLYPQDKNIYTYWDQKTRARDRNVGWRIDYFFISKNLIKKVKDFVTLSTYMGSDHCPIMLDIDL